MIQNGDFHDFSLSCSELMENRSEKLIPGSQTLGWISFVSMLLWGKFGLLQWL